MYWTHKPEEAFEHLKKVFISVPILKHLDPTKQVIVEVDASDIGAGAVLLQQFGEKHKLHLVTFFPTSSVSREKLGCWGQRAVVSQTGSTEVAAMVRGSDMPIHYIHGSQEP